MAILFIIDGPDGSGKSTEQERLVDLFKRSGYTSSPISVFDGHEGSLIRLKLQSNSLSGEEAIGIIVGRFAHLLKQLSEVNEPTVYVMDRGIVTTMAEQGILDNCGISADEIYQMYLDQTKDIDLAVNYLFVTASVDTITNRLSRRETDKREEMVSISDRVNAYHKAWLVLFNSTDRSMSVYKTDTNSIATCAAHTAIVFDFLSKSLINDKG